MTKKLYWPEIDGLRFIAFLLVFIHHFKASNNIILKYIGEFGWIGVDLFFFLSAFLLTTLLKKEFNENQKINIKFFFIRRILRIWPLYFIYIAYIFTSYIFLFSPADMVEVYNRLGGLVVFIDNIVSMNAGYNFVPGSNHLWTISMEEQFYLLLPFTIPFLIKKESLSKIILPLVLILILILRLVFSNSIYPFIYVSPLHFDAFLFGILMGLGYLDKIKQKMKLLPKLTLLITLISLFVFMPNRYVSGLSNVYLYLIIAVLCTLTFDLTVNQKSLINKILRNSIFAYLGKISYGLYVFHILIIAYINIIIEKLNLPRNWYLEFFITLLATITISVISFEFYEKHFLKLKQKYTLIKNRI